MKIRLSKVSSRWGSKRSDVVHVTDAKFASLNEKTDFDVVVDDEIQHEKTLKMLSSSKLGSVNQQQKKMFQCNKCGKVFQSSKALCGHMACHSVKEKALKKKKKLVIMDSQSDTESVAKNLRMRSRRARYKKLNGYSYSNCSSETSEVEQEQEYVAISLMMLSRDSWNCGGLNSIEDSSENNSVVLEAKSVSANLVNKDVLRRLMNDVDETLRSFGCQKIETLSDSDVKLDNLRRNTRDRGSNAEQNVNLKKLKSTQKLKMKLHSRISTENGSYSAKNHDSNAEMYIRFDHKPVNHSRSNQTFNENSSETDGTPNASKEKNHVSNNVVEFRKMGKKHECPICFKVFKSVQALGGHNRVHLAERSDINKSDEVSASFNGNVTQLHDFIDLNQPAPMEDEDTS